MKQNWTFSGRWISGMSRGRGWSTHWKERPACSEAWWRLSDALGSACGGQDGFKYQEILGENVMPSVRKLNLERHWTFQQDQDPKHTSKSTKAWFQKKSWKILEWSSQSPDLNLIENLWWDLKKVVAARKPKNIIELKAFAHEEWVKIPQEHWQKLTRLLLSSHVVIFFTEAEMFHCVMLVTFCLTCGIFSSWDKDIMIYVYIYVDIVTCQLSWCWQWSPDSAFTQWCHIYISTPGKMKLNICSGWNFSWS